MSGKKVRLSFDDFYLWFEKNNKKTCVYDLRNQSICIPNIGIVLYFNDVEFDPTFRSIMLKNGANKFTFTGINHIDMMTDDDTISTIVNIIFKNKASNNVTLLLR